VPFASASVGESALTRKMCDCLICASIVSRTFSWQSARILLPACLTIEYPEYVFCRIWAVLGRIETSRLEVTNPCDFPHIHPGHRQARQASRVSGAMPFCGDAVVAPFSARHSEERREVTYPPALWTFRLAADQWPASAEQNCARSSGLLKESLPAICTAGNCDHRPAATRTVPYPGTVI